MRAKSTPNSHKIKTVTTKQNKIKAKQNQKKRKEKNKVMISHGTLILTWFTELCNILSHGNMKCFERDNLPDGV